MSFFEILTIKRGPTKVVFLCFAMWTLFLLCRPQDYIIWLQPLRPAMTLCLMAVIVFIMNCSQLENMLRIKQFKMFLLFLIIMSVGVPFSFYPRASFEAVVLYGTTTSIFFFLFVQIARSLDKLYKLLFIYCCGVFIYISYIFLFGKSINDRIFFGAMFDPNDIAFFIINFITFNFLFLAKEEKKLIKIFAVLNVFLSIMVILNTGSRSGLLSCLTVFAYLIFIKNRTIRVAFPIKATVVALLCVFVIPYATSSERYLTLLDLKNDYNLTEETGRIAIWKIGFNMLLTNPVTGVGVSCFNEGVGRNREERGLPSALWQSPHNSIIQVGAETGFGGLFIFLIMSFNIFAITNKVIKNSKSKKLINLSEMTRVGFIGHCVSSMFLSQAYSIYWVFYVVLSAALNKIYEKE